MFVFQELFGGKSKGGGKGWRLSGDLHLSPILVPYHLLGYRWTLSKLIFALPVPHVCIVGR